MSNWIDMKSPPGEIHLGREVIACVKRRYGKPVVKTVRWWGDVKHANWQDITHWMPLPELPEEYANAKKKNQ